MKKCAVRQIQTKYDI